MNSLIETLNHWGGRIPDFAWPMLWQSSVLMVVLFAFDLAARRTVRASVRYALWLVVLVKLLLPPTLALPTSLAWWVRPPAPTPKAQSRTTGFVVTYGDFVPANLSTPAPPVFVRPPKPPLSGAGRAAATWVVVGAGLLAWLLVRWRLVARDVRRATLAPANVASGSLRQRLDEARRSIKFSRRVRLRLTQRAMSPAVCGLLRPTILLPQSLVERLQPAQLRAVLLHELVHLQRGDVWVNCAQALLQIFYWWHPLLWLVNARIRRVREEAVDDAVMLALADGGETYAPTLLEVAKLAFNRPLAALGVVGILESRSALRQRIERLMDFRPPRKAGLTIASALCVLAFAALAVPMEKAPAAGEKPSSSKDKSDSSGTISNVRATTNLLFTGKGRQAIVSKLDRIRMDTVLFHKVGLAEVVRNLNDAAKRRDPEKSGINFMIDPNAAATQAALAVPVDPTTGLPGAAAPVEPTDINKVCINIDPPLNDVRLAEVLEAIVKVADKPIKYSIEDYAVVFSLRGLETEVLVTRTLKFDPEVFLPNLRRRMHLPEKSTDAEAIHALLGFLADAGLDMRPPYSAYLKERGLTLFRAPQEKIEVIERLFTELNNGRSQSEIPGPGRPPDRDTIIWKLDQIRFDSPAYVETPLIEVIRDLSWQTKNHDPEKKGFSFRINHSVKLGKMVDLGAVKITVPALSNARLADLMEAVIKGADKPIKYFIWAGVGFYSTEDEPDFPPGMTLEQALPPKNATQPDTNNPSPSHTIDRVPVLGDIPLVGKLFREDIASATNASFGKAMPKSLYENTPGPRIRSDLYFQVEVRADGSYWAGGKQVDLEGLRDWLVKTRQSGSNNPTVTDTFKKPDGSTETKDVSSTQKKLLVVFVTPMLIDETGNRLHSDDGPAPGRK